MIRIAVVEDEIKERETICGYIGRYFADHGETVEVLPFDDGDVFVEEYPQKLDMILMDIEMKRMDGISAARRIRSFDEHVLLLFVTNMVQFALEGYSVDAADFIVKPLKYESFMVRMDKALRKLEAQRPRFLETKAGKESIFVNLREISWVETRSKKTLIRKTDGSEITVSEPVYRIEEKLQENGFFRCHSAYLISMERVQTVSTADATVDGVAIPISKHRRKDFLAALANYRGRML